MTDIAGLGDKSFNYLAGQGLKQAEKKYGIQGDVTVSKSGSYYVPEHHEVRPQGLDLVIAVGFLEEQAVGQVAKKFPNTKFAIVDDSTSVKALKGLKNVEGLLYKEWESGYLAGYLAGLFEKSSAKGLNSANVMSTVGGIAIPPVDHYIAGFQAGAKAADPGVKLLNGYSGDFIAQDKCQGLAQQQIAQGSDIIFQVAGQCGLGAINAARDKGYWDRRRHRPGAAGRLQAAARLRRQGRRHLGRRRHRSGREPQVPRRQGPRCSASTRTAPASRASTAPSRRDQGQGQRAARQDEGGQGQDPDRADRQVGVAEAPSSASDSAGSGADLALELRGSRSASARSPPTTRSTSTCARARCTRCWARTARASRRS